MPSNPCDELLDLISSLIGVDRELLLDHKSLAHDFGVAGLDGEDLLIAIADRFEINMSDVHPNRYFGEESAYNPFVHLWRFIRGRRMDEGMVTLRISDLKKTVCVGSWVEPGN